jgi:ubiquinone biosynthesis protein
VVKVQRPDLQETIAEDIATLTYFATVAERLSPQIRLLNPVAMVREFQDSLRREIDFILEAENIRRFQRGLRCAAGVWIPGVVEERSSRTVLTLEHSPGVKMEEYVRRRP